jgi:hypothetical protein
MIMELVTVHRLYRHEDESVAMGTVRASCEQSEQPEGTELSPVAQRIN